MRDHHDLGHLYRAVLEGLAYEQLMVLSMIEADTDTATQRLRLMGGGARSGSWVQLIADIFERPVEVTEHTETTALGAGGAGRRRGGCRRRDRRGGDGAAHVTGMARRAAPTTPTGTATVPCLPPTASSTRPWPGVPATRPLKSAPTHRNERAHHLVDLQLLERDGIDLAATSDIARRIFSSRHAQAWPPTVTVYSQWDTTIYTAEAEGLDVLPNVELAVERSNKLIRRIDAGDEGQTAAPNR